VNIVNVRFRTKTISDYETIGNIIGTTTTGKNNNIIPTLSTTTTTTTTLVAYPRKGQQNLAEKEKKIKKLKEFVIPLWQALHPSTIMDSNTMELQEQEYFDLFVLVWGSISTWKTLDLKHNAMETKVMVYRLSKTSPEVFESL
jgi:hypothetical protein